MHISKQYLLIIINSNSLIINEYVKEILSMQENVKGNHFNWVGKSNHFLITGVIILWHEIPLCWFVTL